MADDDTPALTDLLDHVRFLLSEPLDFTRTDTQSTLTNVRLLTAAATYFNTFGGEDPHPDHSEKAAMLLRGITQGHPFNDGNKRTGFLVAVYYLRQVGFPPPTHFPADEVVGFCLRVSAGQVQDVQEIAAVLRRWWPSLPR